MCSGGEWGLGLVDISPDLPVYKHVHKEINTKLLRFLKSPLLIKKILERPHAKVDLS